MACVFAHFVGVFEGGFVVAEEIGKPNLLKLLIFFIFIKLRCNIPSSFLSIMFIQKSLINFDIHASCEYIFLPISNRFHRKLRTTTISWFYWTVGVVIAAAVIAVSLVGAEVVA